MAEDTWCIPRPQQIPLNMGGTGHGHSSSLFLLPTVGPTEENITPKDVSTIQHCWQPARGAGPRLGRQEEQDGDRRVSGVTCPQRQPQLLPQQRW